MEYLKQFRNQKISFVELVLLISFYLATSLLLLGAFSIFTRLFVLIVLAVLAAVVWWLRPRVESVGRLGWLFALVPAVALGFMLLRGFYVGDVYYHWLPFAREIVQLGYFPDFVNFNWFSSMPLQSLLFAATFALSGGFNEFINLWVPLFFTAATLIVLLEWGTWEGLTKQYLIFLSLLFFTNQGLEWYGSWNLMQEPLVLFFATCAFYNYLRYIRSGERRYAIFALISFVLLALSKQNGLFLLVLVIPLFLQSRDKKFFLTAGILLSLPLVGWLGRNYFVYGNPVFPIFNSIFPGPYSESFARLAEYSHHSFSNYPTLWSRFVFSAKELLQEFPYVLLSLWGFVRKRSLAFLLAFLGFFLLKESILFSSTSDVRYYYPLLGLLIIYALLSLQDTRSKFLVSVLLSLATYQLLGTEIVDSTSSVIARAEHMVSFLRPLIGAMQQYRVAWSLGVGLIALYFLDLEYIKTALVYTYSLFILKLKFLVNKSWLNAWTAIASQTGVVLAGLSIAWCRSKVRAAVIMVALVIAVNSWILGIGYVAAQGKLEFPVQHIWSSSIWARSVLDTASRGLPHDSFYILIFANRDYFMWYTNYQAVTYTDFDFHELTRTYSKDISAEEMKNLFQKKRIKYIVRNAVSNDIDNRDFDAFHERIKNSGLFSQVASTPEGLEVWQVY